MIQLFSILNAIDGKLHVNGCLFGQGLFGWEHKHNIYIRLVALYSSVKLEALPLGADWSLILGPIVLILSCKTSDADQLSFWFGIRRSLLTIITKFTIMSDMLICHEVANPHISTVIAFRWYEVPKVKFKTSVITLLSLQYLHNQILILLRCVQQPSGYKVIGQLKEPKDLTRPATMAVVYNIIHPVLYYYKRRYSFNPQSRFI